MIIFIYSILLAAIFVTSKNKFGKWINTVSLFSSIWLVVGGFASIGVYGYRIPSLKTNLYSILFVIIVDVILLSFTSNSSGIHSDGDKEQLVEPISNAFIVELAVLIMLFPSIANALKVFMNTYSFAEVRISYFRGEYLTSTITGLLFKQIPMGMIQGLIIYYIFYSFETKRYKALGVALFNSILATFINGGRYSIMLFIYSIVVLWMNDEISVSSDSWIIKYKKQIKRTVLIILLVLVGLTLNRGQIIYRSLIGYFSGSMSFLDYIIQNGEQFELNNLLYGYLTFSFILEPVVFLLKFLGVTEAKIPSYYFNIIGQKYYNVGATEAHYMNANTTIIYYYLRDFGVFGIVIGAVLVAFLTVLFYNRWKKHHDRCSGMLYIFMTTVLFNSIMTNQLFANAPLFSFVAIYLCTHLNKRKIRFKIR